MTYVIIVLVILLIVSILGFLISRPLPLKHRKIPFENLRDYLQILLKRGYNGGFLVIRLEKRKELGLQFSKYILGKRKGVQLDFPIAPWSKPFHENFMNTLKKSNLTFQVTPVETTDPRVKVERFITVDFGRDIDRASQFSEMVFREVFYADKIDTVLLYFENVDPRDTEI